VQGTGIRFRFQGKSGKRHDVDLRDRRLAAIVRRCQDLPGQELFQYEDDDGIVCDVGSADVNAYLREASGADVSAKDFRTWAGTVLAFRALRALEPAPGGATLRSNVGAAMRDTAVQLGNTPAVARNSYVHPAVIEAYLDGRIAGPAAEPEEAAVIRLLEGRRGRQAERRSTKPRPLDLAVQGPAR
jgi:DNA topoisomerase-1